MRKNFPHLLLGKWLFFFQFTPHLSEFTFFPMMEHLTRSNNLLQRVKGVCLEGHLFHINTSFLNKALMKNEKRFNEHYSYAWENISGDYSKGIPGVIFI